MIYIYTTYMSISCTRSHPVSLTYALPLRRHLRHHGRAQRLRAGRARLRRRAQDRRAAEHGDLRQRHHGELLLRGGGALEERGCVPFEREDVSLIDSIIVYCIM